MRLALCAVAALLGTVPVTAQAAADTPLSGEAIRKLVVGNSARWTSAEGRSGTITYHPDGRIAATVRIMGANMSIAGNWSIKGNQFCRTISMDPRPTRCQTVYFVSGKTYRFMEGDKLASTTTFD